VGFCYVIMLDGGGMLMDVVVIYDGELSFIIEGFVGCLVWMCLVSIGSMSVL